MNSGKLALSLAVAAAVSAPTVALAQQEQRDLRLDEILVTAERRVSDVQDVPAAVSAFDENELRRRQASNVIDVVSNVPNLMSSNNPGQSTSTTVFLRGVGSTESIVTLDTAIAFYLDDVYFARQGVNNLSLFDVERVEVLRGPQGTLYGRNTSGGAIRVMTRKPQDEFELSGELTAGNYDRWGAKASLNVPFAENFYGRFNALIEQGDGWTRNVILNRDVNDRDNKGARAAFRWLPNEAVSVDFNYDYYRSFTNGVYGFDIAGLARPAADDLFISTSGDDTFSIGRTNGGALTVEWMINDNLELTSITAARNIYQRWKLDFTDQPIPIFRLWTINDTDQISQELRLSGNVQDGRLRYVTGVFYYDEESYSFIGDEINLAPAPGVRVPLPFFRRYYDVGVKSYAAFAEVNYDITDRLTGTVGGRFTRDDKSLRIDQFIGGDIGFVPPGGVLGYNTESLRAAGVPMDIKDNDFSFKLGLQYAFTDDIMGYFTYAQGYKSGGWSARTNNPAEFVVFDPEYVDSFELGLKTLVLDGRARLNYTAFYYDYQDFFATATGQDGNFIVSTNDAEFYGVEFEGTIRATQDIDLFVAAGWQKGKYKEESETLGDQPQRLPEWTLKAGATYTRQVTSDGDIRFTVDFNYLDDHFTNLQNSPEGRSGNVELWNATLAYEFRDGRYEVFASCKNCFDKRYIAQSFDFRGINFIQVYPGDPRTWLVGFRGRW